MESLIARLRAGNDLSPSDVAFAVTVLLSSSGRDEQKADFLTALHHKGETAAEIAAFVDQLMHRAVDPGLDQSMCAGPMIDVCGTGGDGLDLFNVSTTIMFVVAAAGAVVVKHGNRSVTSSCGSADVLEALGIRLTWEPEEFRECVQRTGVGFLYARHYHPAFGALAGIRERLARAKTRTVFNLLGPLLNPARPPFQLIGVYDGRWVPVFAGVAQKLHRRRVWVVHGATARGGIDDVSISGSTLLADLDEGSVHIRSIAPADFGLAEIPMERLQGGGPAENARIIAGLLSGEISGPMREMALANAAAALVVAGLSRDLPEGVALAAEQIESGRALARLRALQDYSGKISR